MGRLRDGLERFVKSFAFSFLLFLVWGGLTAVKARSLLTDFELFEAFWVAYNATLAILFVVRSRPSIVSLHPAHWIVALVTSFAGLLFVRQGEAGRAAASVADGLVLLGMLLSIVAALTLRRSYDFLPALRGVHTDGPYALIRHPMYAASILIRLGYLVRHFGWVNLLVFVVLVWLYDRRASFEEEIMRNDGRYRSYAARVRHKFLPGVY
jgi:protein-S-isoprenylcysteine O-methyltransferase Ste14